MSIRTDRLSHPPALSLRGVGIKLQPVAGVIICWGGSDREVDSPAEKGSGATTVRVGLIHKNFVGGFIRGRWGV